MSLGEDVVLELLQVYKAFDHNALTIEVLRGIELVVRGGESLAITGASGAGKSTLLNIMGLWNLRRKARSVLKAMTSGYGRNGTLQAEEQGHGFCIPVPPPPPGIQRL